MQTDEELGRDAKMTQSGKEKRIKKKETQRM